MAVFNLDQSNKDLMAKYHGCGDARGCIVDGEVVDILYDCPLSDADRRLLPDRGTILRGTLSCFQFITAAAKGRPQIPAAELTGLGAEIRRRRDAAGKSIRAIALIADVPEETWTRWEKTRVLDAGAERLDRVAGALDCTVADLLAE